MTDAYERGYKAGWDAHKKRHDAAENSILFHGRRADEAERRYGELQKAAQEYDEAVKHSLDLIPHDLPHVGCEMCEEYDLRPLYKARNALARLLGEAKEQ